MKENWLLFATSLAPSLSPVQLQKILFLFENELPAPPKSSEFYTFRPYDFGPFDAEIYIDAERLQDKGLLLIENPMEKSFRRYMITDEGKKANEIFLSSLAKNNIIKAKEIVDSVRSKNFPELIKSIYDKYPKFKINSVFRE